MKQSIPVYLRVKANIQEKIHDGTYRKDMRLPSENTLSAEWGISRMTVRRALDELTREGVLYRTRGSGTFVAANRFSQCDVMNFSEMVKMRGSVPETEVLEKVFVCEDDIALAMHLPRNTVFYTVKRLRKADGEPVGIEQVFLPLQFCERPDRLELSGSLYEGLKKLYGWSVARQDIAITAQRPTREEKEMLKLGKGEAVMRTEGVSLDSEGRTLLYEKNVYSGSSYIMHVSIKSRWIDPKANG